MTLSATTRGDLLMNGTAEGFKLVVHLGLFGLALTCGLYNLGAWVARRERHLAVNALLYGGLVGLEVWQMKRHAEGILR